MTDLVVLSLEAWDTVWRRNQHLVAGLLRADAGLRVLFVEPAAYPLDAARRRSRPRWGMGLRRADTVPGVAPDALWLLQPTKVLPRRLDPRADGRPARAVARAVERLGFHRPVLWVNDPHGAQVLVRTGWPALYDVTDDWLEAPRTEAEHRRLSADEAILLDLAEEVVVCSPGLARSKGARRPVTLVPNAVDVAAYRTVRPRPVDLPAGPTAVYVGTAHTDRLDVDLCAATARAVRDRAHLVLVGPAPLDAATRRRLVDAGVVLLGPRPYDAVPAYLQHADVLVVPHVVNAFTESLDPIKVYEYRAAGRPVVSTPVAGFREEEGERVVVAEGSAFVAAVGRALADAGAPGAAGVDADVPTWADRVTAMRAVVERVAGRPARAPGA